jgi:hypothetical protein
LPSLSDLNGRVEDGRATAEAELPDLVDAYFNALRAADQEAINRLTSGTLTAAGEATWHVPDADELYPRGDTETRLRESTSSSRQAMITGSMEGILLEFGIDLDLANPYAERLFEQHAAALKDVVQGHVDAIMRALQDAHAAGLSVKDAAALLAETSLVRSATQATLWARTEMVGASNGGSLYAVQLTGVAPYKQWLTAAGAHDPRHHDASQYPELVEQVVPLAAQFTVGGYPMAYPGDTQGPVGERANCRCTVIYRDELPGVVAGGGRPAMSSTTAVTAATAATDDQAPAPAASVASIGEWHSPALTQEGVITRDQRAIRAGALSWRDKSLPLMWAEGDVHGGMPIYPPTRLAGGIDKIVRQGENLVADGHFDDSDNGRKAMEQVATGRMGVSVDLAISKFSIECKSGDPMDAFFGVLPEEDVDPATGAVTLSFDETQIIEWYDEGEIMGATIIPFAAFGDATIEVTSLTASGAPMTVRVMAPIVLRDTVPRDGGPDQASIDRLTLTASAAGLAPQEPPVEWFQTPNLDGPTAITITPEGRVYGHVAAWGTCHTGFPGRCVQPPHSPSDYRYFHLGVVRTAEGVDVPCGQITMEGGHAPDGPYAAAIAHYDNVGTAACDVRCGEDEHGIWCAGAIRPTLSADQARSLRGSKLSGDWRECERGKGLDLIGVLCVNVPGFPVIRAAGRIVDEQEQLVTLVAAGIVCDCARDEAMADLHRRALHARARR